MSENRTMSVMLFVLGLFLIAVGIGLFTVTQTVTRYRNGFQVPYQETIQPYVGVGGFMVLFGIIVLVVVLIRTRRKKTFSMRERWRYPKTEQV